MKNKNVIILLLGIFSLICAVNIFFTAKRLWIESDLASMTPDQKGEWLKDENNYNAYKSASDASLSLGLDLQGGMYVTMRIGVDDILIGLAGKSVDSTFMKAIGSARLKTNESQASFVDLFVESLKEIKKDAKLASYFGGQSTGLSFNATDSEVIDKLNEEAEDAIDRSFNIIRTRIDQFGVASPNLQKVLGTGRILIELPGVKDADRVRKLLRGTAKLEFWPTYTIGEAFPFLQEVNKIVKAQKAGLDTSSPAPAPVVADSGVVAGDSTMAQTADSATAKPQAAADTASTGDFDKDNPFFALVRPPKENTYSPSTPEVGGALISDTAEVNRILRDPEVLQVLPDDLDFLWTAKPKQDQPNYLGLVAIRTNRDKEPPLSGDVITDTRVDKDQNNQQMVSMYMNSQGAKIWKNMTTEYLNKSISIVLDGLVYTYPTVQSVISGGSSQITGNFTVEEAKDLANILKAGKLPAPARIEGEEVVGPSLGAKTVKNGFIAFLLGFIAVIVFIVGYYKMAGAVAAIALFFNLFAIVGVSSALNIVLTLPGIAGIVLTMGMAVDANVLIYERIREELNYGKSLRGAVSSGFQNAFSAIIDGNITTFLVGMIMFINGIGPIRGFAVTLMIGIITTLISGLLITRLILDYMITKNESVQLTFGNPAAQNYFQKLNLQLIPNRKKSYTVVGAFTLIFLLSLAAFGLKMGLDFKGGRQYLVELTSPVSIDDANSSLYTAFENNSPLIKTVGAGDDGKQRLMISTSYLYDKQDADQKVEAALKAGLNQANQGANPQIIRSSTVGPSVADDIKDSALQSIIWSLVVMFLYIFLRFRFWQYGMGAILSLGFNVVFTLGIFSLLGKLDFLPFSVEVDQAFIAAILTIVGYTINDTVIVFDRIRENVKADKAGTPWESLFNISINETLSRTVVTSTTTFITALILFLIAGDVLKGFMLALMTGIIVGTFSSIFVASPACLDLINRAKDKMAEQLDKVAQTTPATSKKTNG